jgi:hypothetical protein
MKDVDFPSGCLPVPASYTCQAPKYIWCVSGNGIDGEGAFQRVGGLVDRAHAVFMG